MYVSVIIPTYNRRENVERILSSLCEQTLMGDRFEVIVVDDGSEYDARVLMEASYPFSFHYYRQENRGATIARNNGAQRSEGEILVFIDDDVTIAPPALEALAAVVAKTPQIVAIGTILAQAPPDASRFTQNALITVNEWLDSDPEADAFIHFSWANTQLLAVKREDFFQLNMLQDPTGGWPNWDDVDFGYRAHLAGYRLLRCAGARAIHWDGSLASLAQTCNRWQRAGKSAVRLFETHPGLRPHIPMFRDKVPIVWGEDSLRLIVRKMLRRLVAWRPILALLEGAVWVIEWIRPLPSLLRPFYRWIEGSYMVRGYQEGLREYRLSMERRI